MKGILQLGVGAIVLTFASLVVMSEVSATGCQPCDGFPCCDSCCCCNRAAIQPLRRAKMYNWHRNYAHAKYGQPVSLVVPPTATLQTNYGWGVSSFRLSRLDHQFGRNYAGPGPFGGPFLNTPRWPQDTNQFGVYSVRGPW